MDRKEYQKKYRLEHKEDLYKKHREYWCKHKEEINARRQGQTAQYRKNNKDRLKLRSTMHRRAYDKAGGEWKCYFCGVERGDNAELVIHHKDQNHSNNDVDNLVCLCKQCHDELHKRWLNVTIPQLIRTGVVDWKGNIQEEDL